MRKPLVVLAAVAVGLAPLLVFAPAQAKSYTVTAALSKSSIVSGAGVVISGKLAPGSADKTVQIQKYKSGKWFNLTTTKTNGSGRYSKLLDPTAPGATKYRAKTSGKGSYSSGTSKTVTVNVYAWLELAELKTVSDVSDLYVDGGGPFGLEQDGISVVDDAWVNNDAADGFGYGKTVWDLKQKCTRIRGRAGIDDSSGTGAIGRLTISFDGTGDYSKAFFGGDSQQISISINKTAKLTIQSSREDESESTIVGLGEPEVLCLAYLPAN